MQRHAALLVDERHEARPRIAVLLVDALGGCADELRLVLDLLAHAARRRRDLDEHEAPAPVLVDVQQALEGEQLKIDALEDVEVVKAEEHGAPTELRRQLTDAPGGVVPLEAAEVALRVDACMHGTKSHGAAATARCLARPAGTQFSRKFESAMARCIMRDQVLKPRLGAAQAAAMSLCSAMQGGAGACAHRSAGSSGARRGRSS